MYNETDKNHGHENRISQDASITGAAPLAEGYPMPATEPLTEERRKQYTENHHDATDVKDSAPVVPEGLTEHKDGESVKEWLKNDWEQTKEDLHLGNKDKDKHKDH